MRFWNISSDFLKDIYTELSTNAEKLMMKRLHYYNLAFEKDCQINYWTSRYLFVFNTKSAFHEIKIFDVFHDKSIMLNIEKSADQLINIYPLKNGFGLLEERGNRTHFISLIFLDLPQRSLQKLYTVECYIIDIVINKADSTTFLLRHVIDRESFLQICKITDKKIVICDVIDIDFSPGYFYDRDIYALDWYEEVSFLYAFLINTFQIPRITLYNIEEKMTDKFDLEAPVGYIIYKVSFKSKFNPI
jgi:hypothetical protein